MVADLDEPALPRRVDELAAGRDGRLVVADVSDARGRRGRGGRAVGRFGGLDVLVNNAGIAQGTTATPGTATRRSGTASSR